MGFDTKIHDDLEFHEGDTIDSISLNGGGGTAVRPVIETLEDDCPEIAIIFTDGEFKMPYMENVHTDVIWIIKGRGAETFQPPKGVVIPYD